MDPRAFALASNIANALASLEPRTQSEALTHLAQIVDTMGRADGKLHLYAGHDWTVHPLLMCVARRDDPALHLWPPFCSHLSFELWSSREDDLGGAPHWPCTGSPAALDAGRSVRVMYNGAPLSLPCASPGDELCSLADFRRLVAPYCVEDWAAECAGEAPAEPEGGSAPAYNRPPDSKL